MTVNLKNTTLSDIVIDDLGIGIVASSTRDVSAIPSNTLSLSSDLSALIVSGDVVVNDGVSDLDATDGAAYISGETSAMKIISLGVDGIYQTTNTSFTQLAIQSMIPAVADLFPGCTGIEMKVSVDTNIEGAATGEIDIYNYTDGASVASSNFVIPNGGWSETSSGFIPVTDGKSYRVRMKRVGGTGANNVQIEGVSLILKGV